MRRMMMLLLVVIGCGGAMPMEMDAGVPPPARDAFVGSWSGNVVTTYTIGGQTMEQQGSTTWSIDRSSLSDDRVTWSTAICSYQAKATTDTSLVLDPATCSPQASVDAGCSATFSIASGSGTRSGTSLSITYGGSIVAQCSGSGPQSGTYTARFDGSKN